MNKLLEVSERKFLRSELLSLLKEAGSIGVSDKIMFLALKDSGAFGEDIINESLDYLVKKDLAKLKEVKNAKLKIGRKIYYISPRGIDYLEGSIEEVGLGD